MRRLDTLSLAGGVSLGLLIAILAFAGFMLGTIIIDPGAFRLTDCAGNELGIHAYYLAFLGAVVISLALGIRALARGRSGVAATYLVPALVVGITWVVFVPREFSRAGLSPGDRALICTADAGRRVDVAMRRGT